MFRNNWNNFDLQRIISNDKLLNINAIKSCIEADEANLLLEIIQNNLKARIYCLICCFTYIPSIKCIERLIAEGTPLNISFEENPFQSTPLEYLHTYFKNSSNYQLKALNSILNSIELGKSKYINKTLYTKK